MKPIQFIVFAVAITIILFASCKKKTTSSNLQTASLNEQFADLRSTPQMLSVQAGRDTSVFGKDSTYLHFYTNSFKDATGNIIASGVIDIKLVEMYKPGDMAANRTSATENGQLLKSGGQANITVTMNGKEVFANKYAIGFRQGKAAKDTMSLYYGGNGNADSVSTWSMGDPSIPGSTVYGTKPDSTSINMGFGAGFYYLFTGCTHFNLVNCDELFNPSGAHTSISVVLPDNSFNPTNTQIIIIIPEINCSTTSDERETYDANTNTFIPGNHENQLPIGKKYEVVIIAKKNGSLYYYDQSGTVESGLVIHAFPGLETALDIKARLAGL